MCHRLTFRLPCEHVSTHLSPCPRAPRCRTLTTTSLPYPPPSGYTLPKCPLPDCPFEAAGQCWNCCWCGKSWNVGGRCSCVMIHEGSELRCEHICCKSCTPAREYTS